MMQKNVKILGDSIDNFSLQKENTKKVVPPIVTPSQQDNIDKRWQEIKVTGENLQSRSFHAICAHGDYFYTYGGYENNERLTRTFARLKIQNSNDQYRWEILTPRSTFNPGTRRRHTLVSYQDKIYLFGGQTSNWQQVKVSDVYEYNISLNEWTIKKNSNKAITIPDLDSHNAFVYKDEMIVFGGYASTTTGYSNSIFGFNLHTFSWRIISANNYSFDYIPRRSGASLSQYKDYIYIFGGQNEGKRFNDLWRLNIAQATQSGHIKWECIHPEGDTPLVRNGHQSAIYEHYLFVFGGIHNMTQELNDVQAYDIKENKWIQVHTDSNFLYSSSPALKNKKYLNLNLEHSDSRDSSIRNSLRRADYTPSPSKHGPQRSNAHTKQSKFKKQNSSMSSNQRDDQNEFYGSLKERNQSASHTINNAYSRDSQVSYGKFLVEQKQKEFRIKKQHFLSSIEVGFSPERETSQSFQKDKKSGNQAKQNDQFYSRSDSPLTIALKSSLIKIGNQGGRHQTLNNSNSFISYNTHNDTPSFTNKVKNLNKSYTNHTIELKLPPIIFEKGRGILVGKKPCARDGHACCLVRGNQLLIFGGDRHNMSFNDLYLFDLDMAISKHISQASFE